METIPHGLCGLHAVSPVAQELVEEAESVITRHRKMAGRAALVAALKLTTALNSHVLVSLVASQSVLMYQE